MTQHVPTKPIGCFLDYTYCDNPKCENACGRKMSDAIKDAIRKISFARVAYSDFCGDDDE